jgi:hypothetical protein
MGRTVKKSKRENFISETIPAKSPRVYEQALLRFTYSVIQYADCEKVRVSNLSMLTEVRISK